ncbi:MAG: DUF134 domain-containing protein [Candidatus Odinarchaeia archaeon]
MRKRWRGCRGPGRPRKERRISDEISEIEFHPPSSENKNQEIQLFFDELEAMRLVDFKGLSQTEAGESMNVSRGTIWRLLESGRRKVIEALIFGKKIVITPRVTEEE